MGKIKEYVGQLQNSKTEDEAVKALQNLGKYILTNCTIKINNGGYLTPIWIEAYCFIDGVFPDESCDGSTKNVTNKKKRQGKENNCQYNGVIEKHWGKEYTNLHFSYCPKNINSKWRRRARVDIVPEHKGTNFALSYLLKLCNYESEFKIQSEIAELLKDQEVVLEEKSDGPRNITVEFSERVGIKDDRYLAIHKKRPENYNSYDSIRDHREDDEFLKEWLNME